MRQRKTTDVFIENLEWWKLDKNKQIIWTIKGEAKLVAQTALTVIEKSAIYLVRIELRWYHVKASLDDLSSEAFIFLGGNENGRK